MVFPLPADRTEENAPSCSLLVVDDEPAILDTLSRLLANHFDVALAASADEAQIRFGQRSFDIILADQRMPGRCGAELLEWVRLNSPQTIRLMMTGYSDFDHTVRAINRGQIYRSFNKDESAAGGVSGNTREASIPQTWVVGNVEDCVKELTSFVREYGITDLVTWAVPPGMRPDQMNGSLERFVRDVAPRVKAAAAAA